MSLIWKLELRDKSVIKVNDPWPDPDIKGKPGADHLKINAILHLPETRDIAYDEYEDPVTTVHRGSYVVAMLPVGQGDPADDSPQQIIRIPESDVVRVFELHSWAEVRDDIVAEALGLNEDDDEDEDEAPAAGAPQAQAAPAAPPAVPPAQPTPGG